MNNNFQKSYQLLILQQNIFRGSYLITEWNWEDAWDSFKGYIGLDPSKSEKAAEAAEKAAAEENNKQIIKIALDIPDSDLAKAKEMISKNPQLHAHFSKITDPKKQRYFIANLVAQKKAQEQAAAKAKKESTFNKPTGDEGKMYNHIEDAWGPEFAEDKWKLATRKKCVVCINKKGQPYFVSRGKFTKHATKYLRAAERYKPKDDTIEDDFIDILKDAIKKKKISDKAKDMLEIYIEASGKDKVAATADFAAKFKKKEILFIDTDGKPSTVTFEDFTNDTQTYINKATQANPNRSRRHNEKINKKYLDNYTKQLTELLKNKPFEFSDNKVERYLDNIKQQKKILCLVKTETPQKPADKLISENFDDNFLKSIMDKYKTIYVDKKENPRAYNIVKNYEFKLVSIKDFAANQTKYMDSIEELYKELSKEKADKKAKDNRKLQFFEACQKYQTGLQANLIATKCIEAFTNVHGRKFTIKLEKGTKMYDWLGKESATWNIADQIQSTEEAAALRTFLNTGWKTENPAHPMAIVNVLKKLIDKSKQDEELVVTKQFRDLNGLCQRQISKAEDVIKDYPEFKLKV